MKVDVLLGLQWGDEGKGKIVDVLAPQYDIIARFQGGPNAGHTIEFNGNKFILHTIPSGIFHNDKINVIGNGVVIDPSVMASELAAVEKINPDAGKNLLISKRAHLITPTHRVLDAAYEHAKGDAKIGTTLKGISPSYTDKISRNGLRVGDIKDRDFKTKYNDLTRMHYRLLDMLGFDSGSITIDGMPFREFCCLWMESLDLFRKLHLVDAELYLNDSLNAGKKILAEGAQGTLLDIDFGSYPYVTSSNTTCGGACTGLGIAPRFIGDVYGIFKAYCTRVGSGPFPTEQENETGEMLRREGAEFGSTTGRPRRCGWLDLPALRYAITVNGVNKLIMTKADVLGIFDEIRMCTHYSLDDKDYRTLPYEICDKQISPVYNDTEGWKCKLDHNAPENMPAQFRQYINIIENEVGIRIGMISVGADRNQIIHKSEINK